MGPPAFPSSPSARPRAFGTTTRSLSVSFQGESFFIQTSRASRPIPSPSRTPRPSYGHSPPTPKLLENSRLLNNDNGKETLLQSSNVLENGAKVAQFSVADFSGTDSVFSENSKPSPNHHSSPIRRMRSLNTPFSDKESTELENGLMVTSKSNSGISELSSPTKTKTTPRGISVPARFLQETNSRSRRSSPEPSSLESSSARLVRRLSFDGNLSPGNGRQLQPSSPVKGMVSRGVSQPVNAPSIISFAAEVRRAKKGENRIEEAHMLRLLDTRHLQWLFVNARATAALLMQKQTAEKILKAAWMATSQLHESVTLKRAKLQLLTQNLRLTSILKGQMAYLEEWSRMDLDHSSSLSAASEALRASTLRLPIVGGAKADIQDIKDAVGSVVEVMQAMGSSVCSLLSKIDKTNSLLTEISKVAVQEKGLLDQSRDLLSTVAALHVTQCSLRGHLIHQKLQTRQMHT